MGSLLNWGIIFLVIAIVAALLGFGGLAGTAMGGAQLLFWIAIVLLVVSVLARLLRRGAEPRNGFCSGAADDENRAMSDQIGSPADATAPSASHLFAHHNLHGHPPRSTRQR